MYRKMIRLYTHTIHAHKHSFFKILFCYRLLKILNIVPCIIQ